MIKLVCYLVSMIVPVVLNIFFASRGAFNFVSPLFCIPVILGVFFYRRIGVWLSFGVCALYVIIEMVFNPQLALFIPMSLRVLVYILIAILVYAMHEREQKTQAEIDTFFDINADMMCASDLEGKFLRINRAFEKVLGYETKEIVNVPFIEFVHPDDREATMVAHNQLLENNSAERFVNRYRCRDGSYKYIEWRSFFKDSEVYSIAHDVTDRVFAERLREGALKRYQALLKISDSVADTEQAFLSTILSEAIALTESHQGWLYYVDQQNRKFSLAVSLSDQTEQTLAGRTPLNDSILLEVLDKNEPVSWNRRQLDSRGIDAAAGVNTQNVLFVPVFDQDGIAAIAGVANKKTAYTDTDEAQLLLLMKSAWEMVLRRRTEQTLEKERKWFEATLLSISDGVVATDLNHNVRVFNSHAAQLTRLPSGQLMGKPISEAFVFVQKNEAVSLPISIDIFASHDGIKQRKELVFVSPEGENKELVITVSEIYLSGEACEGYLYIFQDVTQQKKDEQQIIFLTYHDKLTGLYNRRFFEEELVRLDQERNLPLSIIIGDVNGLKLTNDAFGHMAGDQLLTAAADAMRAACRKGDIVARWGGDEFIILLPNTGEAEAAAVAEHIREMCSQKNVGSMQLSISLGWAVKIKQEESAANVIKYADDMMYKRKLLESRSIKSRAVERILQLLHKQNSAQETHFLRVSRLCTQVGEELGLTYAEITDLDILGRIHDIGTITIDASILNKPGLLTPEELEIVRRHAETGYHIITASPELAYLANFVLTHHERWDGLGYPNGLKGVKIPLLSRVLAVADAYEAMTGERTYCKSMSKQEALEELKRCAGSQF